MNIPVIPAIIALALIAFAVVFAVAFAIFAHIDIARLRTENAELRRRLAEKKPPVLHLYDWRQYERQARRN